LVMDLLDKYEVSFIYIDHRMKYSMDALEYGLLEYIGTSSDFAEVYNAHGIYVYEVSHGQT